MITVGVLVDLARLSLAFGRVDRITAHPDGTTPESDTDHTVMLGLIACSLATRTPGLDAGLVAQFALVHDVVEVYAGDMPTLLPLTPEQKRAKDDSEFEAYARICSEFSGRASWLPIMIEAYEARDTPEARFVKAVDKLLPKLTHLLNNCAGISERMTPDDLRRRMDQQHEELAVYASDFPEVMGLHVELSALILDMYSVC